MNTRSASTHCAPTLLVFLALAVSALPACEAIEFPGAEQSTKSNDTKAAIERMQDGKNRAVFPEAIRGEWMMGPEPCYLPLNADADGQLTITADKMYGYEDTYELVGVVADPVSRNTWTITTAEHLGDQLFEMSHIVTLAGSTLIVKHGNEYRKTYVKCAEKRDARNESRRTYDRLTPVVDVKSADTSSNAKYPAQLRGEWMEGTRACRSPINYDSEMMLIVGPDMLGQYENTSKAISVNQISNRPPTWKIISTASPGTAEYSGRYAEIFTLVGNQLTIEFNETITTYTRCN